MVTKFRTCRSLSDLAAASLALLVAATGAPALAHPPAPAGAVYTDHVIF